MTRGGQVSRGGAVLTASQVASNLCSLGRTVIIARLISPADFGIAAILLLLVSLMEMISNVSVERLIIQAPDGNKQDFLNTGHFIQAIRGLAGCLVLLALAYPVTVLFSIPHTRSSFYGLALVPLIIGFSHLDPRRMERTMRFWPNASVELFAQIVVLALAWPMGKWCGDYRAMLFLLLIKALVMSAGSHAVAERPYRWSMDGRYVRRFLSFGWPLLLNGLLMYAILHGDRFILGSAKKLFNSNFDMADVGLYSAAFILAMMPAMLCIRVCSTLFLPMLSGNQHVAPLFDATTRLLAQLVAIVALAYGTSLILIGDRALPLIYGVHYQSGGGLVAWLGVMWSVRIARVLPVHASMAKGNTVNLLYANCVRALFLFGVLFVAYRGGSLIWLAVIGTIGELCAYVWSVYLNKRTLQIPSCSVYRASTILACILLAVFVLQSVISSLDGLPWVMATVAGIAASTGSALFLLPELRRKVFDNTLFHRLHQRSLHE